MQLQTMHRTDAPAEIYQTFTKPNVLQLSMKCDISGQEVQNALCTLLDACSFIVAAQATVKYAEAAKPTGLIARGGSCHSLGFTSGKVGCFAHKYTRESGTASGALSTYNSIIGVVKQPILIAAVTSCVFNTLV